MPALAVDGGKGPFPETTRVSAMLSKLCVMDIISPAASLFSLYNDNLTISETEEKHAIKLIQKKGDQAFFNKNFTLALKWYNNALDIEENNLSVLASRAAVCIEMGELSMADRDAKRYIALLPSDARGHYLLAVILDKMGNPLAAFAEYLTSLELDEDPAHMDLLTSHVAGLAPHFCYIGKSLRKRMPEMDPYRKLSELGDCLFVEGKHELCIRVLNTASKVATKQKGITMKVQLTLANAHSALKHTDIAISLYQECLVTAIATHDYMYQTKALVNIGSLFLEIGQTYKATLHYEKLLSLQKQLRGGKADAPLPSYWTTKLQCGLLMNLSLAYKAIGNLQQAGNYAKQYKQLVQATDAANSIQMQSFLYNGQLEEVLGNYLEALDNYTNFLKKSKLEKNKYCIAQAYGCLGSLYATLGNHRLAVIYHEQHIVVAENLGSLKLIAQAYELFGDSKVKFQEYDGAIESYMIAAKTCKVSAKRMCATALCKIGKTYRTQNLFQYSIFYFERAKEIAENSEYLDIIFLCQYNMACVLQYSMLQCEHKQARNLFNLLIPDIEAKIEKHREEGMDCPTELMEYLEDCYKGMVQILVKSNDINEALVYSESLRKRQAAQFLTPQLLSQNWEADTFSEHLGIQNAWGIDKIFRVVSQQNATVVYYTVLHQSVLIWVLQPTDGRVRFFSSNQPFSGTLSMNERLRELRKEMIKETNNENVIFEYDNRSLPERDSTLTKIKHANRKLAAAGCGTATSVISATSAISLTSSNLNTCLITVPVNAANVTSKNSAEKMLFDILVTPFKDLLDQLDKGSLLVFILDGEICSMPFGCIQSRDGIRLKDHFSITYFPSLFIVDRVFTNELCFLQKEDDIDFQRVQARLGGIKKHLVSLKDKPKSPLNFLSRLNMSESEASWNSKDGADPRRTSNPRLVKSGPSRLPQCPTSKKRTMASMTSPNGRSTMSNKLTKSGPTSLPPASKNDDNNLACGAQLLGVNNMTTLSTKTATNTDICKGNIDTTKFVQVSGFERALVIGSPHLPETVKLYDKDWMPCRELGKCRSECLKVAEILGVPAVVGKDATKEYFLKELEKSTIIHIATYASTAEGLIVMSPNANRYEQGAPLERSYIVNTLDIANLTLVAKLVVLSSGWGTTPRDHTANDVTLLPSVFLLAGAQCVLSLLWPIPDAALQKFYFYFYQTLQSGNFVLDAVTTASKYLEQDERYSDMIYWAPFAVLGKDVMVDLDEVRHAMLDQTISEAESDISSCLGRPPLNRKPVIPFLLDHEQNLHEVQHLLSELLVCYEKQKEVIPELIMLLDSALKRQHLEENNRKTTQLPACLRMSESGLRLLRKLGFHFQGRGVRLSDPYILYPHWNPDELLIPVYDSLRAMVDVITNPECSFAISEFLPTTEDTLSYIIDVLCITKHAPELQLNISDMSVQPLWRRSKVKVVLVALGFSQIGPLLNFNSIPSNRKLLNAALQLFISVSAYKSPSLIHKLDVTLLGEPVTGKNVMPIGQNKLPSLRPTMVQHNQIFMTKPWMTTIEHPEEMDEKMQLAVSKETLFDEFSEHLSRARTWHQVTLSTPARQAKDAISHFGTYSPTVKVKTGGSASTRRVPVDEEPKLRILDSDQRRDYAHFVYHKRLANVNLRHQNDLRKLYMPYVENMTT